MPAHVAEQVVVGVSTRGYKRSLEPVDGSLETRGESKSNVSRALIENTTEKLADFLSRNTLSLSGVLSTVSTAALWQIAYAPYVSDYSRYLPADTGARSAFWASFWGCSAGSMLPMALGWGEGGEQTAPLGRAVAGGLLASMTAKLFVLPSVFAVIMGRSSTASVSMDPDDTESRYFDHAAVAQS